MSDVRKHKEKSTELLANDTQIPLRQQLKAELKEAMKTHQTVIVATLRAALAEIDHAEAVAADTSVVPLTGISQDVPRKVLTEADIRAVLQREVDEIRAALAEYEAAGHEAKTAELRAAWALLMGYLKE